LQDWRELYRLHAKLPAFRKRLEKTKAIISEALQSISKPYVAVSFGKDSIVLTHLLIQQKKDIPIVWSDRGPEAELPETYPYIEKIKAMHGINLQVIYPSMSMFEIYRRYGLPEIDDGVTRSIVKEVNLVLAFAEYVRINDIDGYFQGLRAEESNGRRWYAKKYGHIHYRKRDNLIVCNPLLHWSARDIWGYIVSHDIPHHPEYDNERFKNREMIRLSNWSGLYWAQNGRMAELRYYHPELYRQLVNEFPEVKTFV